MSFDTWADPFAEPLSHENAEFVRKAGKWTAFDLGAEPPYQELIGRVVTKVALYRSASDKVIGIQLAIDGYIVRADVEGDELTVDLATSRVA